MAQALQTTCQLDDAGFVVQSDGSRALVVGELEKVADVVGGVAFGSSSATR
jgi:hypothetical protein